MLQGDCDPMSVSPQPLAVRFDEDISVASLMAGRGDMTPNVREAAE